MSRRLGQEEILPPLHFHPMTGAEQASIPVKGRARWTVRKLQSRLLAVMSAQPRGSGHSAPVEFSSLCRPPPPGSGSKRGDCSQGK